MKQDIRDECLPTKRPAKDLPGSHLCHNDHKLLEIQVATAIGIRLHDERLEKSACISPM